MSISVINPILKEQINEITNNKNPLIPFEIKKKGNDEYFITISLEPTIIANSPFDSKQNYEFILYIQKNYPYNPPRLYCLTDFNKLNLSELRDLLEDVIKQPFNKEITLLTILNLLPKFLSDYFGIIQNNPYYQIGKFYLDDIYNIEIINKINKKYFKSVNQELTKFGKSIHEEMRFLLITNNFFFLFINTGIGIITISNMKLAFWGHIRSLDTIRHTKGTNCSEYIWKTKKKRFYTIHLKTYPLFDKETDKIVDILIDNLKNYGIHYSITTKNLGPKTGELPPIEINMVEDEINKLEIKIKNPENLNKENLKFLMSLYEKAIQYYSAINDNRYESYTKKIQSILSEQKYINLLGNDNNNGKDDKKIENGSVSNEINIHDNVINIEEKKNEEVKVEEKKIEENNVNVFNIPQKGFIDSIKEKLGESQKEEDKKEEIKKEEEKKEEDKKEEKKEEIKKEEEMKEEDKKEEKQEEKKEEKKEEDNKEEKKEEEKKEEDKKEEKKEEEKKEEEKKEEEKKEEEKKESIINSINKEELNLDLESSEEDDEDSSEAKKTNTNPTPTNN